MWRFLNRVLGIVLSCCAVGCMAPLTPDGAAVRLVTKPQKELGCEFLTIVTASETMGSSTSGDAASAMNKARNKVAAAGGNAMVVVSANSDIFAATVVVEALRCDLASFTARDDLNYERIPLHRISVGYSKLETEEALGMPNNVIGSKQFSGGVVEVWSYQRWRRQGVTSVLEEEYWVYFWDGKVHQWGRPGDWQREADTIHELRMR